MAKKSEKSEVLSTSTDLIKSYPQLQKYNVADLGIAEMEKQFSGLVIKDMKDTEGYKAVSSAISFVRTKRLQVEKTRKELKADSLNYGRIVDSEAKRIQALIEPIESRLQGEKDRIDNEKEQIRLEKERKEQELLNGRKETLFSIGFMIDLTGDMKYKDISVSMLDLQVMNDAEYTKFVSESEEKIKADKEAIAKEEAEAERKRQELIAEAERLEKLRQEQAEAQAKIDEANRKIQREKEIAKIKEQAEFNAKINAEKAAEAHARELLRVAQEKADAEIQRIKAEAEEKERIRIEQEQLKKERLEEEQRQRELLPDKEKIFNYIKSLKVVPKPELKSAKMKVIMNDIIKLIDKIEVFALTQIGGKKQ